MLPLYSDHLVSGRTGLRTVGLARPSLPAPGLRGVAFHVLSSAEAAVGAGFDLERIGLRAVRGSPFFVKLGNFAKNFWTWKIKVLRFAKLTCESRARKWPSAGMAASLAARVIRYRIRLLRACPLFP
jgi:hypothetical protein